MLRGNETITMRGFATREGGAEYSPLLEIEYTLEAPTTTPTRTPTRPVSPTPRRTETPRPTATATRTATPTPTATRTRTPTATATDIPATPVAYLPIALTGAEVGVDEPTAQPVAPGATPTAASPKPTAAAAADITWVRRAPLSMRRGGVGVAADDAGRVYAVGGSTSGGPPLYEPSFSAAVERYDPDTFGWQRLADLGLSRDSVAVAVAGGRVFAVGGLTSARIGGGSSYSKVEEYRAADDEWVAVAGLPTSLGAAGAVGGPDGKVYVFGGIQYVFNIQSPLFPERRDLDTVFVYDPARNAWTRRAPMPRPIVSPAVAVARNGRIYVLDGSDNYEYDPRTDLWATRRGLPTARTGLGAAGAPDGLVYAAGGFDADSKALAIVEAYDPARDTWTRRADMLSARGGITLVAGKGSIFAVDGSTMEEGILP